MYSSRETLTLSDLNLAFEIDIAVQVQRELAVVWHLVLSLVIIETIFDQAETGKYTLAPSQQVCALLKVHTDRRSYCHRETDDVVVRIVDGCFAKVVCIGLPVFERSDQKCRCHADEWTGCRRVIGFRNTCEGARPEVELIAFVAVDNRAVVILETTAGPFGRINEHRFLYVDRVEPLIRQRYPTALQCPYFDRQSS